MGYTFGKTVGGSGTGETDCVRVSEGLLVRLIGGDFGGTGGGIEEGAIDGSEGGGRRSIASRSRAVWMAFRTRSDGLVESVTILEGGLAGGRSETTEVAAGRKAGYETAVVVTSVSVTEDRELTLLMLDFALDFALDLALAKLDNFDFFSGLLLFVLASLFVSSCAFIDCFVWRETWERPGGKLEALDL